MPADLSTTFTGVRFQNPFLLSSAPPTESESNIVRAFEAGWGGVVTKTIGLHPVVNVLGPKTKFLRADVDSARLSMKKRPGAALHSSWNWELISDKTLDWWVPRLGRIKKAFPRARGRRVDHGRFRQRHGAAALAGAGAGVRTAGLRRAGAQSVLSAHGSSGHGIQRRQGQGARVDRDEGGEGGGEDSGVGQAHAIDHRHRCRGARRVPRRRGRDRIVEHVHLAAADRRRDAGVRGPGGRFRLDGRTRRPGNPSAVAGENVAAHAGVSPTGASRASAASRRSITR